MSATRVGEALRITITAVPSANDIARAWPEALAGVQNARALTLAMAPGVNLDTGSATLIATLEARSGLTAETSALNEGGASLLARVRAARKAAIQVQTPLDDEPDLLGLAAGALLRGRDAAITALSFTGEISLAAWRWRAGRRQFRVADLLAHADAAGVQAIPLILLLGFLMGLILAFQSSIPLKRFGADVFIVNLVSLSLTRELGPLLAAIILAGRTGSAFAAELGTQVVNEEVAALRTMGIDPVRFLVLPRLAAAMLIMPGLALLLELAGMLGMAAVMLSLGFPPVAIWNQTRLALKLRDVFGGLFKALWFGAAVSLIGCSAGLNAGNGPRAVGEAATAAVVGGIFSTIVIDGIFTILYYRLGF